MRRGTMAVWAVLWLLAGLAGQAAAQTDTTWQAKAEYWWKSENWSDGEPTAATDAHVNNGGTSIVDHAGEVCDWLWVGESPGDTGVVWMTAGDLSATVIHAGAEGEGSFTQTDGLLSVANDIYLGFFGTGVGRFSLWAGEVAAQRVVVGASGTGEFSFFGGTLGETKVQVGSQGTFLGEADLQHDGAIDVTGGTFDMQDNALRIGGINPAAGHKVLCGLYSGTFAATDELIGFDEWAHTDSHVEFYQLDGTHTVADDLGIGCGGYGYYKLSGGELTAAWERIASDNGATLSGDGDFLQTGGTHNVTHYLVVGKYGHGTYTLEDGALNTKNCEVGSSSLATGEFLQTGGTHTVTNDMYLGYFGTGTYTLRGGTLDVGGAIREGSGAGTFVLDGGTLTVGSGMHAQTFILGKEAGRTGEFTLAAGQSMEGNEVVVGQDGTGRLHLTGGTYAPGTTTVGPDGLLDSTIDLTYPGELHIDGGTVDFSGRELTLNSTGGPAPQSWLSAGSLTAGEEYIGRWARPATFIQTGGTHTVAATLHLYDGGRYELRAGSGQLTDNGVSVGMVGGPALFIQIGGTHTVNGALDVGEGGRYELRTGTGVLNVVGHEYVGYYGAGTFWQQGGTHTITNRLSLGFSGGPGMDGQGTYELLGGDLSANEVDVGTTFGSGEFLQTGGTVTADLGVFIGLNRDGLYRISDGSLTTGSLYLGYNGALDIAGSGAQINVSGEFILGSGAQLSAVPGATIHMTGSAFHNSSMSPAEVAGLENMAVVFEGGPADVDPMEVASRDVGPSWSGWDTNFALDTLQLGGAGGTGHVVLSSYSDNQPGWDGTEAMYVDHLSVGAGSTLDLAGHNLYYMTGGVDAGATVVGGSPTQVPGLMPGIDVEVVSPKELAYIIRLTAYDVGFAAEELTVMFSGELGQKLADGDKATPTLTDLVLMSPEDKALDSHFLLYNSDLQITELRETGTELAGTFELATKAVAMDLELARIVVLKGQAFDFSAMVVTTDGYKVPINMTIPEPGTLSLLALGAAALLARRKRRVRP